MADLKKIDPVQIVARIQEEAERLKASAVRGVDEAAEKAIAAIHAVAGAHEALSDQVMSGLLVQAQVAQVGTLRLPRFDGYSAVGDDMQVGRLTSIRVEAATSRGNEVILDLYRECDQHRAVALVPGEYRVLVFFVRTGDAK